MLPPFVPPSARMPAQPLPLITEFVFDRGEPPIEPMFSAESWEPEPSSVGVILADHEAAALLPSIDEFLMQRELGGAPAVAGLPSVDEAAPDAPAPAEPQKEDEEQAQPQEEEQEQAPETAAQAERQGEPVETSPEMPPAAIASTEESAAEQPNHATTVAQASGTASPSDGATEAWVTEERNAFDWQGAANLAPSADEERHASEEWSSTDWDRHGSSPQDRVLSLLAQVARRVRSGELHVHATQQMSAEAALAAVLAALLAEPEGQ